LNDNVLESVFIRGRYVGRVLPRGCQGFESFDDKQRWLGVFQNRSRARAVLEGEEALCADC
jgi:hypothetical protein